MKNQRFFIYCIISWLLIQALVIVPTSAVTITTSSINPTSFSPDGNSLNDTTIITITSTASQYLLVNFFNQTSGELVAEDRVMTEGPSGTYKYTWNGKDDSNTVVEEGTYTIRISDNPSQNGDTIGTVTVDLTPPTSISLSINAGATYTNSQTVNLTISATGASQMKVSNSADFSGATWETYAATKQWTLTSSDALKTVYINFRDTAGANASTSDTITLDTTINDPVLSINSGASSTNTRTVTLSITANDATYMKVDNDTNFNNMSWIAVASTRTFTMPVGADGTRTVYLRVKDDANNQKTTSDSISLDTTAPTNLTLSINSGESYTNTTNVTLTISASGGPAYAYISRNQSVWTRYTYTTSLTWTTSSGDGLKTVYYKAADSAGNNATAISATITLDTTAPSPVQLSTPTDGQTISDQTPTFTWTDPNSDTKNFEIQILQSGSIIQNSTLNSTTLTYTASTLAAGTYYWKVRVYDRADNTVITSQRSFTIQVTGLASPTQTYPANGACYNNSVRSVIVVWSTVTSATGYDIWYGLSEDNLSYHYSSVVTYYTITTPTLSDNDTVYWKVGSYNTSTSSEPSSVRSIIIDTQKPTGLTISIEGGDACVHSTSVTLTLSATNATSMKLSNYANFTGASWETYATSKAWTLLSSEGTKIVYFIAKDSAGAVSETYQWSTSYANIAGTTSDYIILDTTAPTVSDPSPSAGGSTTTTTSLTIRAVINDTGSGINTSAVTMVVDSVSINESNLTITSELVRYIAPTIAVGTHTVNVTATDLAGYIGYLNWSFTVSESSGENPPPSGPSGDDAPSISAISHTPTTVTDADIVTVQATVTADAGLKSVDLFWDDGTLHSKVMTKQTGSIYKATIGPFSSGKIITYYIVALDNSSVETESGVYSFTVRDTTGPAIIIVSPTDGSIITDRTPTIKATYSDAGTINTTSIVLTLDATDVTTLAQIKTNTTIEYTLIENLTYKQYTVTLSVKDNSGNTGTQTWTFTIVAEEVEMSETIETLPEGETKSMNFEDYETALLEIELTAAADLENVVFTVTTQGEKPTTVTAAPTQSLYMYLIIDANIETTDVSEAVISFKVEKLWVTENNIDLSTIHLVRYTNGAWQQLTTTQVSQDDTYLYFEATSPGFSVFAIVGQPVSQGLPWIPILGIIIILVVVVVLLVLFKTGYLYFQRNSDEKK